MVLVTNMISIICFFIAFLVFLKAISETNTELLSFSEHQKRWEEKRYAKKIVIFFFLSVIFAIVSNWL